MFKFTIRDLLWLTIVAALAAGWWVDRSRLKELLDEVAPRSLALELGISLRDGVRYPITSDSPNPSPPARNMPSE